GSRGARNPADIVTAWIALSESTLENGAMRVIPGSHTLEVMPHTDTFAPENLLSRGQEIRVDVDAAKAVALELAPGEMSLHHVRLIHGSEPNPSDKRRIGLAVRYIPTYVRQTVGMIDSATLVRGSDRYRHFRVERRPIADLAEAAIAHHADVTGAAARILMRGTQQGMERHVGTRRRQCCHDGKGIAAGRAFHRLARCPLFLSKVPMFSYVMRRLLFGALTVVGVSIVVFVLMRILPGDPLVAIFGPEGYTKLTDQERASYMAELGLGDPLFVQYLAWLRDIARGDLGHSFFRSESVAEMILRRGPLTAQIAFLSVVLSWLVGIPIAILSALRPNTLADH